MSIKGILFDLDGTLLNTLDDLADSCNRQLEQYGYPAHPVSAYRYFVGNGARKLVERALPDTGEAIARIDAFLADFRADYTAHCFDKTSPYPGIPELLARLKETGLPLAVLSNKPDEETRKVTAHYFSGGTFSCVAGHKESVGIKPDPEGVHAILAELGLTPGETAFIGDTWIDMQTAVNSGCLPVGVLWGFRDRQELEENGAQLIAESPEELFAMLTGN